MLRTKRSITTEISTSNPQKVSVMQKATSSFVEIKSAGLSLCRGSQTQRRWIVSLHRLMVCIVVESKCTSIRVSQHLWTFKWVLKIGISCESMTLNPHCCLLTFQRETTTVDAEDAEAGGESSVYRLLSAGGCCYVSAFCSPAAQLWTNPCWLFRDHMAFSLRLAPRGLCCGQHGPPHPSSSAVLTPCLSKVFDHTVHIHKNNIWKKCTQQSITSDQSKWSDSQFTFVLVSTFTVFSRHAHAYWIKSF